MYVSFRNFLLSIYCFVVFVLLLFYYLSALLFISDLLTIQLAFISSIKKILPTNILLATYKNLSAHRDKYEYFLTSTFQTSGKIGNQIYCSSKFMHIDDKELLLMSDIYLTCVGLLFCYCKCWWPPTQLLANSTSKFFQLVFTASRRI